MTSIQDKPSGLIFSSSLTEIVIKSDSGPVNVEISASGDVLYSERQWVYDGSAVIVDVGSMIEQHMRMNGLSVLDVSMDVKYMGVSMDTAAFKVLYCERTPVMADAFPEKIIGRSFLTSVGSRRVPPGFSAGFSFAQENSGDYTFYFGIWYRIKGMEDIEYVSTAPKGGMPVDGVIKITVDWSEILSFVAASVGGDADDLEIVSFTLFAGSRILNFIVDGSLSDSPVFLFRNIFNTPDFIAVPALTSSSTDVERSLAVIASRSMFYDRNVTENHEVQTAPVTVDEVALLSQLVASWQTYIALPSGQRGEYILFEILVTESDCVITDGPDPDSVKFTWRHAGNRPGIIIGDLSRIFTSQYNPVFS